MEAYCRADWGRIAYFRVGSEWEYTAGQGEYAVLSRECKRGGVGVVCCMIGVMYCMVWLVFRKWDKVGVIYCRAKVRIGIARCSG